jgi:hypothetical protein
MRAQYELTQRFTAEYSIRVFLERYPQQTLARLREWAVDPNVHVRRLVSEGLDRSCPGRTGCGRFSTIQGRCSSCSICSRTTQSCWYVGRSPTT